MPAGVTEVENQGVIEIRDPEIDVTDIMRQIRQNMAIRERLPPLAAALGRTRLCAERMQFRKIIQELHAQVNNYGTVDTRRAGWRGKAELLIKKFLRKLVGRYIAQQQEVHAKLLAATYELAQYLDQQEEVLHQRFDQCDLQVRNVAVLARQGLPSTASGTSSNDVVAA